MKDLHRNFAELLTDMSEYLNYQQYIYLSALDNELYERSCGSFQIPGFTYNNDHANILHLYSGSLRPIIAGKKIW